MSKRLKEIILRNHYKPTEYINMSKPLALRDRVSLKKAKPEAATCITEMAVLMSCWKQHEFSDADCSEEISLFNKCLADAELLKREATQAGKTGSAKRLSSKQINELLWKYPLPKEK
ncbi:small ribosomal subunit protein mS37-like [Lytechinus pictus]|uniref:small ribosomal subunit protein mS37-like n=1 Tax=Lytechinus pictus TaxID=7653 RepID=UPI00240CE97C|nr:coiled-coil-helix-coiled-coil-helix domain-containing protein 1-like [Lytechinus pictus]